MKNISRIMMILSILFDMGYDDVTYIPYSALPDIPAMENELLFEIDKEIYLIGVKNRKIYISDGTNNFVSSFKTIYGNTEYTIHSVIPRLKIQDNSRRR